MLRRRVIAGSTPAPSIMKKNYNKLREFLADIEHEQWMSFTTSIAKELVLVDDVVVDSILERWQKNWKPYKKLSEDIKDKDREWADKILDSLPIRCPIYQCGGFMATKERKLPKDFIEGEHYHGDDQTPDLICDNCGGIYQFVRFKK